MPTIKRSLFWIHSKEAPFDIDDLWSKVKAYLRIPQWSILLLIGIKIIIIITLLNYWYKKRFWYLIGIKGSIMESNIK